MTALEAPQTTLLAAATALRPMIEDVADQIERERHVPRHIIDALDAAGIFSMLLPEEFGGQQVDLEVATQVTTEVARADASAGWQVVVGAGNQYFLGKLPEPTMRKAMSVGGNVFVKGALAPMGRARDVPGGFVISGRWPLASGSYAADWVPAGFMIMGPDGPRKGPDGRPDLRIAFLRPEDVTWYDTWDSMGLRGTQSQDFSVDELFIPEEWTGAFLSYDSSIDAPWFRLPPMPTAPLFGAVVVGALKGMVDDILQLAPTKKPAFGGGKTLAEDPVFTTRFGELVAGVEILEAANQHAAEGLTVLANGSFPVDEEAYRRLMAIGARIQHAGTELANELLALAGTSAVYSTNTMQRRWRDIRCAAMHVNAGKGVFNNLGVLLCQGAAGSVGTGS